MMLSELHQLNDGFVNNNDREEDLLLKKSAHFFNKLEAYLNFEGSRQREGRQRLPQDVRVA